MQQIEEHAVEVQKYKIILNSLSKEHRELEQEMSAVKQQNCDIQEQWRASLSEMNQKIAGYEENKKKLEAILKQHENELKNAKIKIEESQSKLEDVSEKYEQAFSELEKAKIQIEELSKAKDTATVGERNYDDQLASMKEANIKKIRALMDESARLKDTINKKDNMIALLEAKQKKNNEPKSEIGVDPMEEEFAIPQGQGSVKDNQHALLLNNIRLLINVESNEEICQKLESMLNDVEANALMKIEMVKMQAALDEYNKKEEGVKANTGNLEKILTKKIEELEKVCKDTQTEKDLLMKNKQAINMQISNLNDTLKAKEKEIQLLNQSRDSSEKNENKTRQELMSLGQKFSQMETQLLDYKAGSQKELASLKNQLVTLIANVINNLGFTFMECKFPIKPNEMDPAAQIALIPDLIKYLAVLREKIENNHKDDTQNIKALKDQIASLDKDKKSIKEATLVQQKALIESLQKEKMQLNAQISELENQRVAANTQRELLEDTIKLKSESEVEKMRQKMNEELKNHSELIEQMQVSHKDEIVAAANEKIGEINKLEEKVKLLEGKLLKKKEKKQNKKREAEEILKKQEVITSENVLLKKEISEANERSASLEKLKESLEKQIGELQKKFDEENKICDEQSTNNAALNTELQNSLGEISQLRQQMTLIQQSSTIKESKEILQIKSLLEEKDKALKVTQQRLLQAYEENNLKVNQLQDIIKKQKGEMKPLLDTNTHLEAECKRLQALVDEAKSDMKKMMNASKKLRSSATGLMEAEVASTGKALNNNSSANLIPMMANKSTNQEEIERVRMEYEDLLSHIEPIQQQPEVVEKEASSPENLPAATFIQTLDCVIQNQISAIPPNTESLVPQLQSRIAQIKQTAETHSVQAIETFREQILMPVSKRESHTSSSIQSNKKSLKESLDILKQSVSESEKAVEEKFQKKLATTRKIIELGIKKAFDERPEMAAIPPEASKHSPERMSTNSALELQYKSEIDHNNNYGDEGTQRTVSFGLPEADFDEEETHSFNEISQLLEQCKANLLKEKSAEMEHILSQKLKMQEEAISQKLVQEYETKLDQLKKQAEIEQAQLKKEIELNLDKFKQRENELRSQHQEIMQKLESEKSLELDELIKIKEKEIKANLNIEVMKTINAKKDELMKQYLNDKDTLVKEFEALKKKLSDEMKQKSDKLEREYNEVLKENEKVRKNVNFLSLMNSIIIPNK